MSEKEFVSLLKPKQATGFHKKYWGVLFSVVWGWAHRHVSEIVVGLIILILAAWLGLKG